MSDSPACHGGGDTVARATGIGRGKLARTGARLLIVGPANAGKSALFTRFAKSYAVSANYPQTTIETLVRQVYVGDVPVQLVDTPGVGGLSIQSDDERLTRDLLLNGEYEGLLVCADVTRMKRSLALVAQLAELGKPMVVALNMVDEAARKGFVIDPAPLAETLGVPVVSTAASIGVGIDELTAVAVALTPPTPPVVYKKAIENALRGLTSLFPEARPASRGELTLFLTEDPAATDRIRSDYGEDILYKAALIRSELKKVIPATSLRLAIFAAREMWADRMADRIVSGRPLTPSGMAQSMAWASRHPVWGWPIMLAIMYATYQGVAHVATFMADTLDGVIFGPIVARLDEWLTIPQLNEFLIGDFGLLTMGVMNAVVTVVPILIVFFGILNLLEDVGYLPNLSVMANRTLSKVGLTGKASLSLALGLGCNTMATMTSRMMETKRERIIVSFLIALGVPCAVQLGILIAILSTAPFAALLLVIGTVMATQIVTGLILNRMLPPERHGDFILELPPFRTPVWRFTLLKTYYRVKWFLYEATPLFMLGAVIMFVLEKTGGLVVIERFFDPIITGFLALPIQATEVFILVLSRRELGAAYFKDMVDAGMVDFYQVVVGLTVMTLFIPCISNTMVMIKELGPRWAISINLGIVAIATLVGGALNQFVRAIF